MRIKVLIADDIKIIRQGLKAILSQDESIEIVELVGDGQEAFEGCKKWKPDVVLMDMRMGQYDGAFGTSKIKLVFPEIKVLVLTTFDDHETIEAAIQSGADGYILKEMEDEKIIQAVKMVYSGMSVFGESVYKNIRTYIQDPIANPSDEKIMLLTARELDIIRCVAEGQDNKEISNNLFLAEGTIRNNISRILEKLKLKDRTQLAVFAVKNNLD
ncbi:response regulator transcription factor [Anaeromicropila populeti]|uniref:Stage 0 sporulation protein A homolog n=1 Tax=Anaeromicropila populeti TaxID=37658 RepID=A0A1I6IWM5_9FIRM|nr:response regulator transcription factor [Anaeromicropila populeti]SFR71071.1 two component transcriptional regulator, LuxR family [Anaeromicropila populeti]